ncbi:MAG: hypothetical protein IBJ13_15390, partial [Sphingopyxis sp.]|nr:hypothetical protein [Sphingopyxis sp.]
MRGRAVFATHSANRNNAKAIMTNPRAQAQSNVSPIRKAREKLKRFFGPWGMFVKGFIKHPVMVGYIVPPSPPLTRPRLGPLGWRNTKLSSAMVPGA